MNSHHFIEPQDVLFLRGNKLFGDPGSFGESQIPPWPSVAAGAIRSSILAQAGIDLAAFARDEVEHPELGTASRPGSFALTGFHLAQRKNDRVEALYQPPADLVISKEETSKLEARLLNPGSLPATGLLSSAPLPLLPILAQDKRTKPAAGYWMTRAGWQRYLAGECPQADDLVPTTDLWALDHRVGVGLNTEQRSADEGKLFSMQAIAFCKDVGFLAATTGAKMPPRTGLRLGGDGRAALMTAVEDYKAPAPDYAAIAREGRCRLVLTTPGLFAQGWLPEGTQQQDDGSYRFSLLGVEARLVCASVPRAEVISGWDLARWMPKVAQRACPTGSLWWLDDLKASPEQLRKLAEHGLWSENNYDAKRRAEGFNRLAIAAWR